MNQGKIHSSFYLVPPIAVLAGAAILEVAGYHELYIAGLLCLAVILTYFTGKRWCASLTAALAISLVIIPYFVTPGTDLSESIINRGSSLLGVVLTYILTIHLLGVKKQADQDMRHMNSLFTHATEGIIITNKNREIILANPYAERMFGYSRDELLGEKIEQLVPKPLKDKHERYVEGFHQNPMNRSMGAGRDLYARRKDDSVFPVEISLSHYGSGDNLFVIAFVIDITIRKQGEELVQKKNQELKEATLLVQQMNAKLEQKVEDRTTMLRETLAQLESSRNELAVALEKEKELGDLKSRFVSMVSHEFRTPLSTILSSTSLIGKYEKTEEQEKRDKHIFRIKEQVHHMKNMLEDLLVLGKLEEGLLAVKLEEFELREFLEEFVNEMQGNTRKGQTIVLQQDQPLEVTSDTRLVKNILINLVSNAIKFSPENSQITVKVEDVGDEVKLSVSDQGIGIREEDKKHLFERFYRAGNAQNIKGTGLGLHIVIKYLELLHGDIGLESEPEKGTTFTVSIPVKPN